MTPCREIAQWNFTPGAITKQLMDDYTAEVQPEGRGGVSHRSCGVEARKPGVLSPVIPE